MLIIAKLRNVRIDADTKPREWIDRQSGEKSIVFWATVLVLGGSFNVRNPKKFAEGLYDEVEVEADVTEGARTFTDRESKQVSASLTRQVRFGALLSAVRAPSK